MVMPEILSVAVPKLVRVIGCVGLGVPTSCVAKVRLVDDRVAFGPETTPVPLKEIDCGLPAALSVMVTEALRGPIWVGVKVMLIVHCSPGGRLEPHVCVWLKSVAFVPATAMLLMFNASTLVLESVTVCGAPPVPTTWFPKLKLVGDTVTVGTCSRIQT
jgi:hypothetical protein